MNKQWILIITALILSVSTYWSLSFASDTSYTETMDISEENATGDTLGNSREELEVYEETSSYIYDMFIIEDIYIGSTKSKLLEVFGEPETEGMYEGGHFYDYGTRTYFVNPETEKVNAIAIEGTVLDVDKWDLVEDSLTSSIKFEGMNEMEGLWMEIYDWKSYDIMVEREGEKAPPFYIWLTEDGLFTENS